METASDRGFDVPVAMFLFRRAETALRIVAVLQRIRPRRMYLIGDGPRDESERAEVHKARQMVEEGISWPCVLITNYADHNRGVFENIAGGARWVFERERRAIFLEDDNLPEETFFTFCEEMLDRYEADTRVLWICGTNYLEHYRPHDGSSYVFTKHLMPCGWASWAHKFNATYDEHMLALDDAELLARIRREYTSTSLYRQQINRARAERWRRAQGERYASWDHQMALSIRANSVYGVCPSRNQIANIGADDLSTHGGTSLSKVMTRRFCGIGSSRMEFPLVHPAFVLSDLGFEKATDRVISLPMSARIRGAAVIAVKAALGVSRHQPIRAALHERLRRWVKESGE